MNKIIFTLAFLLLAPLSIFAQPPCCEGQIEVYYSQIFIDDSQSDPEDQNADGVLIINGIGYVDAPSNPYNHSYSTDVQVFVPGGGYYGGSGGVSFPWDGTEGYYTNYSSHTISCPYCNCSWTNSSNEWMTATKLGYTELYYNFDSIITNLPEVKTCAYNICDWCVGCPCYKFLRSKTLFSCPCQTPCPLGVRNDYKITKFHFPVLGDVEYCSRLGPPHPLAFDPCVPVPPWDPNCSITIDPKPFP